MNANQVVAMDIEEGIDWLFVQKEKSRIAERKARKQAEKRRRRGKAFKR